MQENKEENDVMFECWVNNQERIVAFVPVDGFSRREFPNRNSLDIFVGDLLYHKNYTIYGT